MIVLVIDRKQFCLSVYAYFILTFLSEVFLMFISFWVKFFLNHPVCCLLFLIENLWYVMRSCIVFPLSPTYCMLHKEHWITYTTLVVIQVTGRVMGYDWPVLWYDWWMIWWSAYGRKSCICRCGKICNPVGVCMRSKDIREIRSVVWRWFLGDEVSDDKRDAVHECC